MGRDVRTFGKPTGQCIERPAAYALLHTPRGVPLVEPVPRILFLPGGGIEAGESPETTVIRELLEETRIVAKTVNVFCEAVQYFTSKRGDRTYKSHMYFIACSYEGTAGGAGDHDVRFVSRLPPESSFTHQSHHWALAQYLSIEAR